MPYDLHIYERSDWDQLVERDLDIVIDPVTLRIGQFFFEGGDMPDADRRWRVIAGDIGALVQLVDEIVLRDQLPAFNYKDTYDRHLDFGDPLGEALNLPGDQIVAHVDVEYEMYAEVKSAALAQLGERLQEGPPTEGADTTLKTLEDLGYQWEPSIDDIEPLLRSAKEKRLARFLLGQLVFAGYAQQTGAPHVLSPVRSRMVMRAGLDRPGGGVTREAKLYEEVARRFREAGPGWRDVALPWTPSFVPYLLGRVHRFRFKEGPDVLLKEARELAASPAVDRYRNLRSAVLRSADDSQEAAAELSAAADQMAAALDADTGTPSLGNRLVAVLPDAVAATAAEIGAQQLGAPPGPGAAIGIGGAEVLRAMKDRLWGWWVDALPFRSAKKLLTRAAVAEIGAETNLAAQLRSLWEPGRS